MSHAANLRKAAILVASLDAATADELLAQMPARQASAVRAEVAALGPLDPREQDAVIQEFFRIGPLPPPRGAKETSADEPVRPRQATPLEAYAQSSLPPRPMAPERSVHERPMPERRGDRPAAFAFLHDTDAHTLVRLLEREHPQVIALVASHLPPSHAADVLAELSSTLQLDVIRRLADIDETSPEIVEEVERELYGRLTSQASSRRRRAAGVETVTSILDAADSRSKHKIMRNLDRSRRQQKPADLPQRDTSRPIKPEPARVGFDDVQQLDDQALVLVLQATSPQLIVLALAGAPPEFVDRVCRLAPAADAAWLRDELLNLGATRLSDVEHAQQELAAVAQRLVVEGRIAALPPRHLSVAA